MNKRRLLFSILTTAFGIFLIIFGEIDDSPGGQFLGLIAIIIGVAGALKSWKKNPGSLPKRF